MPPLQKALVGKFTITTLLFGVVFSSIHLVLQPDPQSFFPYYLLLVVALSIIGYWVYFRGLIEEADFQGDGRYYFPHLYFVGTWFTPIWFIYFADGFLHPDTFSSQTFLIMTSGFWVLYLLIIFICWHMAKAGNEDWKMNDDD